MSAFLTLIIFILAVYGLANALAYLKIGIYLFGDPVDELTLKDGRKIAWKSLVDKGTVIEIEDHEGRRTPFMKEEIRKIEKRRGLGRIPYVGAVFYCPACLAFWIGMAASLWFLSPATLVCPIRWKAMILDGLTACAAAWLLHAIALRMLHKVEEA